MQHLPMKQMNEHVGSMLMIGFTMPHGICHEKFNCCVGHVGSLDMASVVIRTFVGEASSFVVSMSFSHQTLKSCSIIFVGQIQKANGCLPSPMESRILPPWNELGSKASGAS